MTIELNKPEPTMDRKHCVGCFRSGKNAALRGKLIHWPSNDCMKKLVMIPGCGGLIEPFSLWLYTCRWCRSAETRRRNWQDRRAANQEVMR